MPNNQMHAGTPFWPVNECGHCEGRGIIPGPAGHAVACPHCSADRSVNALAEATAARDAKMFALERDLEDARAELDRVERTRAVADVDEQLTDDTVLPGSALDLALKYKRVSDGEQHESGCGLNNTYKPYRCDCGGSVVGTLSDIADDLVEAILAEHGRG